jgi:hypothetical protein
MHPKSTASYFLASGTADAPVCLGECFYIVENLTIMEKLFGVKWKLTNSTFKHGHINKLGGSLKEYEFLDGILKESVLSRPDCVDCVL